MDVQEAITSVRRYTMLEYGKLEYLWAAVQEFDHDGREGALVEAGVWKGGASAVMALAHMQSGPPTRHIHLFDSFKGLPPSNPEIDGNYTIQFTGSCCADERHSHEVLAQIGYPEELITWHSGWFADTMPSAEVGDIAMLHLDGDWYESTMTALTWLWPRLVVGGQMAADDYYCWGGCGKAVDEYLADKPFERLPHNIEYIARRLG